MSYCAYVASLTVENVHRIYHDLHYGTPIYDDNELFGRLILEINQAGLSWDTILKKEANFRKAYDNYDIATIANYQNDDFERLLQDVGVIRNRLKINAAIYNAQQIKLIQQEFGSFKSWLDHHCENTRLQWTQLFKKTFKFVGGEIVNEFLMSTGYLPGAHVESCFRFEQLKELK
jgi:DNA-3-methyladenine glycosylase I